MESVARRRLDLDRTFVIAHISDLHCGSQYFVPNLMERTVFELNELAPDLVVVTGDLTDMGYSQEYKTAKFFLDQIECANQVMVPGNHDARHVGYVHFEDLFGARSSDKRCGPVHIVGLDSSEPDLDSGRVGRDGYKLISGEFKNDDSLRIVAMHHHVLPVPGAGRERNIVYDAGDLLEVLSSCEVDLVLSGHKHVPYVWRLGKMLVVNAGTASSMKLRGKGKPCYNVIELEPELVTVFRKYPFGDREQIAEIALADRRQPPLAQPEAPAVAHEPEAAHTEASP
jgi:3',5'-cyclic-AMP phosphodiesterase